MNRESTDPPASESHDLDQTVPLRKEGGSAASGMDQPSSALFGEPVPPPRAGTDRAGVTPESLDDSTRLGGYALIGSPDSTSDKPFAEGGEGRIYLAQPLGGGPMVVLKTPRPEFAKSPTHNHRLVKEAEQLLSMSHASIVEVFEIGHEHDPRYYTMTHLPGGSLAARIREAGGPMPLDETLRLAIPLADAVRYVHDEKGVSHRDIKPLNVLLDAEDRPVFVDFGLARDNTGDDATIADGSATRSQRFKVGTAMYMAPELLDGKAGSVPTDIYAFGVMLFEMATGTRPYDALDFVTLDKKKRLEDFVDPAVAHSGIHPFLARIIRHALARRVRDRYASMEDLHEDLLAVRDGDEPIHAPTGLDATDGGSASSLDRSGGGVEPDTSREQQAGSSAKPPRRRVLRLAATATLLGGVVLGGFWLAPGEGEAGVAQAGDTDLTGTSGGGDTSDETSSPIDTNPADPEEAVTPPVSEGTSLAVGGRDGNNVTEVKTHLPIPPKREEPSEMVVATESITDELLRSAPRDTVLANRIALLADAIDGDSDAQLAAAYALCLHRAASFGLSEALAVLVVRADDLGVSSGVTLDNGYTWLQTAVYSPDTGVFANNFVEWMRKHSIDPSILTRAPSGTKAPMELAEYHGRNAWVEALQKAIAASESG